MPLKTCMYHLLLQTINTRVFQHWQFLCQEPKICICYHTTRAHPVKIDLNKKFDPKQKTIQTFNIDAQGFRKRRNENPPTREIGVTS